MHTSHISCQISLTKTEVNNEEEKNFLVPITYKWDLGVLGLEAVRFIGQKNIDGLR